MRRISEIGFILLLFLISMNTMLKVYSSSVGVDVQFSQLSPTNSNVESLFDKNSSGSLTIIDQVISWVSIPINFSGTVQNLFKMLGDLLFGYENILLDIGFPVEMINPVIILFRLIITVTLIVTGLDIIAATRGGKIG